MIIFKNLTWKDRQLINFMSNGNSPFNQVANSLCTPFNSVHFISSMPFNIYNNVEWAIIYNCHIEDEKTED